MKHILKLWEGISNLIKILIGIAALAYFFPKIFGAYNNYDDSKKEPTTDFKFSSSVDLYKDETQWLIEDSACQNLEDEKNIKYCLEIKEACSEFIPSSYLPINNRAFSTCVAEVRERLGMPPIVETDIFDNTQTVEGDTKIT